METKPGYLTTEFWITVLTGAYMALNATGVVDQIPDKYSALALAILGGAYSVARGQAKSGVKPDPS